MLSVACLAALVLPAAWAEIGQHKRLVGLLEIPKIFGGVEPKGPPGAKATVSPGKVKVFAQPQARKWPVPQEIDAPEDIPSEEFGYERSGAVVVARKAGWYKIELASGEGWVAKADAGKFHSLEDLVTGGMAYFTAEWDGKVYSEPKLDASARTLDNDDQDFGARVLSHKRTKDGLWFEVRVMSNSGCEGTQASELAIGWVPAHSAAGPVNVWFYSRGC